MMCSQYLYTAMVWASRCGATSRHDNTTRDQPTELNKITLAGSVSTMSVMELSFSAHAIAAVGSVETDSSICDRR